MTYRYRVVLKSTCGREFIETRESTRLLTFDDMVAIESQCERETGAKKVFVTNIIKFHPETGEIQ